MLDSNHFREGGGYHDIMVHGEAMAHLDHLVEADRHLVDSYRRIKQQRMIISKMRANGGTAHSANALLGLLYLMLPIVEDLRQQIVHIATSTVRED